MEIKNYTPFPNLRFSNYDAEGRSFGIFVVKLAFDIGEDGLCRPSAEQEPLVLADEFRGEVSQSSVLYSADSAPFKPHTDVTLDAITYAPGGHATQFWSCGISVIDPSAGKTLAEHVLRVTGPRQWERRWRKWRLSEAEDITSLPVTYEYAFGGSYPTGTILDDETEEVLAFEQNPVGRGFRDWKTEDSEHPIPAPQIFSTGSGSTAPGDVQEPAGFGPLQASWLPRRPLGGTYDDDWEENEWPGWARDYDFAFHNAAPKPLQINVPADRDLSFVLKNLHPRHAEWRVRLPKLPAAVMLLQNGLVLCTALRPDGIFFDIGEEAGDDRRVFVTARVAFNETVTQAMTLVPLDDAVSVSGSLLDPPHPHDVVDGGNGWPNVEGVDLDALRGIGAMRA